MLFHQENRYNPCAQKSHHIELPRCFGSRYAESSLPGDENLLVISTARISELQTSLDEIIRLEQQTTLKLIPS